MLRFLSNVLLLSSGKKKNKEEILKDVVMQYTSGNMYLKLGKYVTEEQLEARKEAIIHYDFI